MLNTCTVTAAADQDARAAIRRIRRKNPGAQILVTGCYAQRAPEEIAALPGVRSVIGNSHKHQVAEIALGWLQTSDLGPSVRNPVLFLSPCSLLMPEVRSPKPEARFSSLTSSPTPNFKPPQFSMHRTSALALTSKSRTAATIVAHFALSLTFEARAARCLWRKSFVR